MVFFFFFMLGIYYYVGLGGVRGVEAGRLQYWWEVEYNLPNGSSPLSQDLGIKLGC